MPTNFNVFSRPLAQNVTTEVTTFLSNVASLDLSDNLCGSWNEVTTFISALPSLQVLNMSGNVVDFPWRPAHQPLHQCSLTTLVLNRCGITWQQAVAVGTYLPSLRALHLCSNAITSLLTATDSDLLAAAFPSLATLDLEDNQLRSWEEVQILRHLPKLHTLLLSGNELQSITYESGFVTLQRLMLGSNRLAHWSDVDQLDAFPDLHDIRLSDNPLTEHDPGAARYEVIARIDRLTSFNGSEVKQAERRDAELAYMRRVTDELAASATEDKAAVAAAHPRFGALTDKYGELAAGPGAAAAAKGSTLSSGMVELVLVAGSKALKKKLPGTLTVGRLKPLLERLMRVKVAHQALMLVPPDADGNDGEEITHDEGRELNFFGVTNGWKIVVQVRSPEDAAAAAAAARRSAAALQELRMEEHEAGLRRLKAEQDRLMAK